MTSRRREGFTRWAPLLALAFCGLLGSCLGPGLEPPSRQGAGDGAFGNDGASSIAAGEDANQNAIGDDGDAMDAVDPAGESPTPGASPPAAIDADAGVDDDGGVE